VNAGRYGGGAEDAVRSGRKCPLEARIPIRDDHAGMGHDRARFIVDGSGNIARRCLTQHGYNEKHEAADQPAELQNTFHSEVPDVEHGFISRVRASSNTSYAQSMNIR